MRKMLTYISLALSLAATTAVEAEPAIVVASELFCRAEPRQTGKILARLPFGYPLEFSEKSEREETIGGIRSHWVKEKRSGCWLFGGYLRFPAPEKSRLELAQSELFLCDVATGGIPSTFSPLLFGDHFVVPVLVDSYFMAPPPGVAVFGILVGHFQEASDSIRFSVTDALYYDNTLKSVPASNRQTILPVFVKESDGQGTYFSVQYASPHRLRRDKAESECKFTGFYKFDKGLHPVNEEFATFSPSTLEKIQQHFPLVRNRGQNFVPVGW